MTDPVLVIPRSGLPVGGEVADRLGVPFDVVVVSKVGAPDNPELAVGAAAGGGSTWWNGDLLSYFGIGEDYLGHERERGTAAARDEVSLYRGGDPLPGVAEKCVVVVDDGVVTDAIARTYLRRVVTGDAEHVVLAVPVDPPNTLSEFEAECDTVAAVESLGASGAIGAPHRNFARVSGEEAVTYLRNGAGEH